MTVVGDLVARDVRDRQGDAPVLRAPVLGRTYDYRRLCTSAWKAGNFLRHLGVREGHSVAIADEAHPTPLVTFLGATLLGAAVRFDPPTDTGARVVVARRENVGDFDVTPGTRRVAYGGRPNDPTVAQFERDVPSENPTEPPETVTPDTVALVTDEPTDEYRGDDSTTTSATTTTTSTTTTTPTSTTDDDRAFIDDDRGFTHDEGAFTHDELLAAARRVAEGWSLAPGDEVAVRTSLANPGSVAAGVLAPICAGAVVLFPGRETVGDVAVADGDAPELAVVSPDEVL